jgi:hypothetical protein
MKTIKTLAFASLVAFSTLAFTACGGAKSGDDAATDSTAVEVSEGDLLQDETTNAVDNSANMMEADSTVVDSTATESKEGM